MTPPDEARTVVLSLGSNLGDRLASLQHGVDVLCAGPGLGDVVLSPVYETVPVGGPGQPDYLNAVLVAVTVNDTWVPGAGIGCPVFGTR